jgi:hypothetical protein
MRAFKAILLTGTAVLALAACSSDKGPGEIGSIDDIVIRNAGDKNAPPPPSSDPIKEVKLTAEPAEASATTADAATPSADEVIAAADTGKPRPPKAAEATEAMAQEAAAKEDVLEQKAVAEAEKVGEEVADKTIANEPVQDQPKANDVAWNQTERAIATPPVRDDASIAEHVPAEPPVADQFAAQEAQTSMAAAQADTKAAAPTAPVASGDAPAMVLTSQSGPMPLDPAVLQSKDPAAITALQKTLKSAGYYKGPLNGTMTSDTLNGYVKYQTAAKASGAPVTAAAPVAAPVTAPTSTPAPLAPSQVATPVAAPAPAPVAPTPVIAPTPTPSAPSALIVSRRAPEPLPPAGAMKSVARAESVAAATQAAAPVAAAAATNFKASGVSLSDPAVISAAQAELAAKGLYTGTPTGTLDTATLNALSRFQGSNGLVPGGLNLETLKLLGVVTE